MRMALQVYVTEVFDPSTLVAAIHQDEKAVFCIGECAASTSELFR